MPRSSPDDTEYRATLQDARDFEKAYVALCYKYGVWVDTDQEVYHLPYHLAPGFIRPGIPEEFFQCD